MPTRGSIGNAISGTTGATNVIVQSLGAGAPRDAIINLLFLKGVQVYQRGSAALSLSVVRHTVNTNQSSSTNTGRWCNYANEITSNLDNPYLIAWSATPTADLPVLATAMLGPNQGDYVHMMFEKPVEVQLWNVVFDPLRCFGLQISENIAYDLDVTWIFEYSRTI